MKQIALLLAVACTMSCTSQTVEDIEQAFVDQAIETAVETIDNALEEHLLGDEYKPSTPDPMPEMANTIHWMPEAKGKIVTHKAIALEYSESDEQARWVAYMLCADRTDGKWNRNVTEGAFFHEDPDIATGSAMIEDYKKSGYSRGHLAPAADMKWDSTAQVECFLFSNMSPQEQSFNSGIWNRAEEMMRRWANWYDTIYIITGPQLTCGSHEKIGTNGVTVPKAFYKAVYCPKLHQAIGFLIPHIQDKAKLEVFAMSIDDLEKKTKINFFAGMDNEETIEANLDLSKWNFNKK